MKLYNWQFAPNCRRVRMFVLEKGLDLPAIDEVIGDRLRLVAGYIETWPVARLLRDGQVNTIWEGPDNILCLDVRRGIVQTRAHESLLARLRDAISVSDDTGDGGATTGLVAKRIEDLDAAITAWAKVDGLNGSVAEARLFPLAQFMIDVYAAALLLEQAGYEQAELGTDRKQLVARLYVRSHLTAPGPLRGVDAPPEELQRFKDLYAGAFAGAC